MTVGEIVGSQAASETDSVRQYKLGFRLQVIEQMAI